MHLCQYIEEQGLLVPAMPEGEEAILQRISITAGVSHDKVTSGQLPSLVKAKAIDQASHPTQVMSSNAMRDFDFEELPTNTMSGDLQTIPDQTQAARPTTQLTDQNGESVSAQNTNFTVSYPAQSNSVIRNRYHCDSSISGSLEKAPIETTSPSDGDIEDNESVEELVDLLSDRMGTLQIGEDGQIRYYGPTSTFGLLNMSSTDPLHVHRSVRDDGQEYLDRLDVGAKVPHELEEHLVNLYFTWQDASFHIVDREMYEAGKLKWHQDMLDTPYYSEALRNAM
ncbi:hypothetical protein SLS60_012049 [Paraconiothyrium brasiliense]|uniref:Uncharacterized protein n=1 Tax=Paraconiothyrium brasiliense TaxID=300254 RepID=A0ABR3QGQ2_9PLEO